MIYNRHFLDERLYGPDVSEAERTEVIRARWAEFLDVDLPKIDAALKGERSIWESDEGHSGRGGRFGWGDGDIEITRRPDEPQG